MNMASTKSIYSFGDYKAALRHLVGERRAIGAVTFEKLASAMRVQKSYLSRVFRENVAHLSADQLFLGCQYLALSRAEAEYLEVLLELARCDVPARKTILEGKIQRIQIRHAQTHRQIEDLERTPDLEMMRPFYLDPIHQLVHICLTIPRFQLDSATRIATALSVSKKKLSKSLRLLEAIGMAARTGENWTAKVQKTHLPPDSPYFLSWRSQLRLLSLNRQQTLDPSESYSFSVVFSATEATRNRIQFRFLDLLKEVQAEVAEADAEHCYQLNFDLLSWV